MKSIVYIVKLMKRKIFLKKQANHLSEYLQSGSYNFNSNAFYLVINNKDNSSKFAFFYNHDISVLKKGIKDKIKKIIFGSVKIKNRTNKHSASVILLTYQSKSIKMFDLYNDVIINKYFDKNVYNQMLDNYNFFSNHFNVPKILEINESEYIVVEELINHVDTSKLDYNLKDELITDVLKRYINYINKSLNYVTYAKVSDLSYIEDLSEFNNDFLEHSIPIVKSLGDLMYKNVLYEDGKFYYIDFELSNNNSVLYDFFTLIYYSYFHYQESFYYNNYLKGLYDKFLVDIFRMTDSNFEKKFRSYYFKLFLYERMNEEAKTDKKYNAKIIIEVFNELVSNN